MLEPFPGDGGHVDKLVGAVAPRVARTDQRDLMLAAKGDLLSDGFEDDLGSATEAVKARQREQDFHR